MTAILRRMGAVLVGAALVLTSVPASAQSLGTQYVQAVSASCSPVDQCAVYNALPSNTTTVTFTITGTWSGTLQFEVTADGSTWAAAAGVPSTGVGSVTSTTGNGVWVIVNYGYVGFRM